MADDPTGTGEKRDAGGSARRRYDSLAERDRQTRRRIRWPGIALVAVASIGAGCFAAWGLNRLDSLVATSSASGRPPGSGVFSPAVETGFVLLAMAVAGIGVATQLFGGRQSTEAYRVGAEGEEATAARLASLPDGWVVLHDRRIPGKRENIDHLVIGPNGLVVVETKSWSGPVVVHRDRMTRAGRDASSTIDQVLRQVRAVQDAAAGAGGGAGGDGRGGMGDGRGGMSDGRGGMGGAGGGGGGGGGRVAVPGGGAGGGAASIVPVRGVVCVHRAEVTHRGTRRRPARPHGVRVTTPADLVRVVRDGDAILGPGAVAALADQLDRALPVA